MKPYIHARLAARRHGGHWKDTFAVHHFFDQTKGVFADMRHRAMLHNDLGIEIALQVFGPSLPLTGGGAVPTMQICQEHQIEDVGRTVPLAEWLEGAEIHPLLNARRRLPSYQRFRDDPLAACVQRWGGEEAAYAPLVAWFERPEALAPQSPLAPAILRNAFGIMLAEQIFGPVINAGCGRATCTRDVGEALTLARFGRIPSLETVLSGLDVRPWFYGQHVPQDLVNAGEMVATEALD